MPILERTRARLPFVTTVMAVGALALIIPVGLVFWDAMLTEHVPGPHWIAAEVVGSLSTYAYLAISSLILFTILGWWVGQRRRALERLSCTDEMTGLLNRRSFFGRLTHEVERQSRTGSPLSVLYLDLDHLKRINDGFGHRAGDLALVKLSDVLRQVCRGADQVFRLGGDEFAVIAPETDAPAARILAERIRAAIAGSTIGDAGDCMPLSVSIGGIAAHGVVTVPAADLVERADRELYEAKHERGSVRVKTLEVS